MKRSASIKSKLFDQRSVKGCHGLIVNVALLLLYIPFVGACGTAITADNNLRERNTAALRQAQTNIEKYRKGAVRIKVLDPRGNPVTGARLEIRQVSHDFKFGCYLKIDDLDKEKLPAYSQQFEGLFNYAVIGTYWRRIEQNRGVEDWSWFDREAALSEKLGLKIAAAPVLWGTSKYGTPRWLPDQKDELLQILERRVRSTVTRNTSVADWEVVNEPLSRTKDLFARAVTDEYISSAFKWAKDAAPAKRMMINESGIFGSFRNHNYNSAAYFKLVDNLIKKGAPVDVIGIQAHANGEWYEPADVAEQLERYSTLGKPIQITEFSAQTHDYDDSESPLKIVGSYRKGLWNADKQAEFYREFYTIAFGNPQVEAIVSWGLDDERAWLPGIGLIDKNGLPKPAYAALDRLINKEWKTRTEGFSNNEGNYELNGFFGSYEVVATTPEGKKITAEFRLENGKPTEWVLHLGA